MSFSPVRDIRVGLNFAGDDILPVGRMAMRDRTVYFEYDASFISRRLELSPLRLPLQPGVQSFDPSMFEGLPGLFYDSLPDGWGRLLFDRFARSQGISPEDLSPLDRLAHVGRHGMGALIYEPDYSEPEPEATPDLDRLAEGARDVLDGEAQDVLPELLALNGSSAGARPKAMIGVNTNRDHITHGTHSLPDGYAPWIVKFPNSHDTPDAGAIEYVYALMAIEAGLDMTDVHLFPARRGAGYFATKRFDRTETGRLHVHSACGLLHSDFRTPSLDYADLLNLTAHLTRDVREVEKMFRLAAFNVLSHNRDDHAKNFSFVMDEAGEWKLSPAYDLTFSAGPRGEQSTMVMGEGRNPGPSPLTKLGLDAKLDEKRIAEIIDRTRTALGQWETLAGQYGVSRSNIEMIGKKLLRNLNYG